MRKKWFKKLGAAFCAAVLSISCLNLTAFAAGETITSFETEDYKAMTGLPNNNGTLRITKKLSDVDGTSFGTGDKEINGVEFSIAKVGEYATVVDANGKTSVMIGINQTLATNVLTLTGNELKKGGYIYLTADQYNAINSGLQGKSVKELKRYLDGSVLPKETGADGEDGVAKFENLDFGIYLVLETNVANATVDGNPIAFSQKQYPYIVSVPIYIDGEGWNAIVDARAKNESDTVDITKKIVRNSSTLTKNVGAYDTDVTHVGDTVEFTLTADVPKLDANAGSIDSYEINDVISKGLTLPETFSDTNIYIVDGLGIEYDLGTHFTITKPNNDDPDIAAEFSKQNSPYVGGSSFTIVFTETGREKLTNVAQNAADDAKFVRVSYTATVNENAVVGPTGNPNEVQLQYAAGGSQEISTDWDEVTEFIFTMEGTKTFDGN
jgi:fimbrial isopeptide formation D2 family protein